MLQTDELRSLRVLHGALCMGCILFLAVLIYLKSTNGTIGDTDLELLVLPGIGSLALLPVSFLLFRKQIAQLQVPTTQPFNALRAALIVHWALIEGACLFNAAIFLATGSWIAFGAAVLALVVLASRAPTETRTVQWLTGDGR